MIGQAVDRLVMANSIPCVEGSALSVNGSSTMDVCLAFKVGVAVTITFLSGLTLVSINFCYQACTESFCEIIQTRMLKLRMVCQLLTSFNSAIFRQS